MIDTVEYVCGLFLMFIFFVIFTPSMIYAFEGPLQVKNQYPIFLHADQPYLEKASMENSFSASLSHSSTYTVQQSGHWLINLDMEITELNLRYKRIIKDIFEFDIDVPLLAFSDGFMDGFLDAYHSTFGFPDYGRSERPLNVFLYEVRKDGALIVNGEPGVGLGDIRLAVKKPLFPFASRSRSGGFNLSVRGDMELPTGSAKKGYGNGSVDTGVSILVDKGISDNVMTYWNFGAVFPGDVRGYESVDLRDFFYGGVSVEATLGKGFSLLAQLQGESAIYPETDLLVVDRSAYLLAFGGRYNTGNASLEISLAEDINVSGAPDFIINVSYKIRL